MAAPAFRTRRALLRQAEEEAEAARIQLMDLPPDMLFAIAQRLSFPTISLTNLGACNRQLRALTQQGVLWKHIDFPGHQSKRMTDDCLSKLLMRVDARNYCEHIALTWCFQWWVLVPTIEPRKGSAADTAGSRRPLACAATAVASSHSSARRACALSTCAALDQSPVS